MMREFITGRLLLLMICTGICFSHTLYAQETDQLRNAISTLKNIRDNYTGNSSLSFGMMYRYWAENDPLNVLDSVPASVQINGNKYHSLVSNTETISNDKYAVILFRDEKVMYLTKPSSVLKGIDSYAMMDSALMKMPGIAASVLKDDQNTTIEFSFPAGSAYKKIIFTADNKNMMFRKIMYVMKTELLQDEDTPDEMKEKSEYSVVETTFFNYNRDVIDESVFDEKKYFIKDKKEYSVTEQFKDFKIFVGSPNL